MNDLEKVKAALKESEARFHSFIEGSPVAAFLLTGKEFRMDMANELMLSYLGKDKSAIGKTLVELFPQLEGQPLPQALLDVYMTGESYEQKSAKAELTVNGVASTYYLDYIYKAITNENGKYTASWEWPWMLPHR